MRQSFLILSTVALLALGCQSDSSSYGEFECSAFLSSEGTMNSVDVDMTEGSEYGRGLLSKYTSFALTTDLSVLSENECRMLPHLFAAADEMEAIFWMQAYGDRDELLDSIEDPALREFAPGGAVR